MTVRALEALIRLSESICRLQLKDRVGVEDCDRAIALFEASTADVLQSELGAELSRYTTAAVANAQQLLRQRLQLRKVYAEAVVIREVAALGVPEGAALQAVRLLVQAGEAERVRGKQIMRVK